MSNSTSIQESFLDNLREQQIQISIFLVSGIRLQGIVSSYDRYGIVLEDAQQNTQLVLKHLISTITPSRPSENDYSNQERPRIVRRGGGYRSSRDAESRDAE